MKKHRLTGIICLILTVMLSGYILLDTFLIQTKMQTNISTDTSSAFLAAKSQLQPNTLPTAGAENAPQSSINPDLLEEESTEPASETGTRAGKPDGRVCPGYRIPCLV